MLGVTVVLYNLVSIVWSETKLIPFHKNIFKLNKTNSNQYISQNVLVILCILQKFFEIKKKYNKRYFTYPSKMIMKFGEE